ncbi:MAG TPA: hypothetical protein ENK25_00705 [Bacteroidetes bacterium]|nr:hypothetical protein [Bacteroidota bacterium]
MKNKPSRFSEDIHLLYNFINMNAGEDLSTFIHCTPSEKSAKLIMEEGLIFENYLTHTSDYVSGTDLVELNYFRLIRRSYGDYTIVIQIDDKLIQYLNRKIRNTPFHFSEVLSKRLPDNLNKESTLYQLPEQFILGYFDHIHNRGIKNPRFDPYYHPSFFEKNLQKLLNYHTNQNSHE